MSWCTLEVQTIVMQMSEFEDVLGLKPPRQVAARGSDTRECTVGARQPYLEANQTHFDS